MYSLFIFSFLYSNSKIEYKKKKDLFLYVRMFDKLFWIHNLSIKDTFFFLIYNLNIKFTIHSLTLFSNFFFFKVTFFTYTHSHQSSGALCIFTIFTKLLLYSFSLKMKILKMYFHFLHSNPTFRILKMKTKYKFLNQTSFFFGGGSHWKLKMKTRKHFFFS